MFDFVISLVILAALALIAGAVALYRRGIRQQAGLMVLLAAVMLVNAAIWLVPTENGESLADTTTE